MSELSKSENGQGPQTRTPESVPLLTPPNPNYKAKHLSATHPDLKVLLLTPDPDTVQLCPDYYTTNARIAL